MTAILADPHARTDRVPPTPFHLSPEQIRSFDENGFLILRQRVTGKLLRRVQEAGDRWIARAKAMAAAGGVPNPANPEENDFRFNRSNGNVVPFRVDYVHGKNENASLELLGSPEILAIAESLTGSNFIPTYESMVFKMAGEGAIIPWHQDAVFAKRKFRIFNIDLYLDKSSRDGGALRVMPKSQTAIHNVCPMNDGSYDWLNGPHQVVEMEPGDILVHDDMVLHGSPRALENPLRRVIYFEFRPIEQVLEEGPWDRAFVDQRLRLVPVALKRYQDEFPQRPQFRWNIAPEYRPAQTGDQEAELRIVHLQHTGGSYCSADSK